MNLFKARKITILKELYDLKIEVIRSRRKTSVLQIVGNETTDKSSK